MDPGYRSALVDFFRRGEVARDVRMLAAEGALAPRAHEQLALLILLADDPEPDVARSAAATIRNLPEAPLRAFLARSDVPDGMRAFFGTQGVEPGETPAAEADAPLVDALADVPDVPEVPGEPEAGQTAGAESKVLSTLSVMDRMKLAMKGTREQRSQLIRDSNKLVSAAVLSSPKLSETEVEAFAKMANVSEEVLRVISMNRTWMKNYGVAVGLARNPKTPQGISMHLLHRLNERDVKMISIDRNVPESLRLAARKIALKNVK